MRRALLLSMAVVVWCGCDQGVIFVENADGGVEVFPAPPRNADGGIRTFEDLPLAAPTEPEQFHGVPIE